MDLDVRKLLQNKIYMNAIDNINNSKININHNTNVNMNYK